ncbi:MAG: hypothetical protein ACK5IQ_05540 [Bacteroidales bacterium]
MRTIDAQINKTTTVQFKTEVTTRQFPDWGYFEYTIKRDELFVNKHVPKSLIEILSVRSMEALYPLELRTTMENIPLDVLNHEQIKERWRNVKTELQKEYSGEVIAQYLSKCDKQLSNKLSILESLRNDAFYALLFHDIYTQYNENLEKDAYLAFPILGFKEPIVFCGKQTINSCETHYYTANPRCVGLTKVCVAIY